MDVSLVRSVMLIMLMTPVTMACKDVIGTWEEADAAAESEDMGPETTHVTLRLLEDEIKEARKQALKLSIQNDQLAQQHHELTASIREAKEVRFSAEQTARALLEDQKFMQEEIEEFKEQSERSEKEFCKNGECSG